MFSKKQNIEDDFMGYNTNNNSNEKQSNGGLATVIQFLIIFVLVGVIVVGGVFGYKYMQKSMITQNVNIAKQNRSTVEIQPIIAPALVVNEQKMYTVEQMQEIVQMMMAKIDKKNSAIAQEHEQNTQLQHNNQNSIDDNGLIASLDSIEVDQMKDLVIDNQDISDTSQKAKSNSNDKVDRYNKVVVDNTLIDAYDLAGQITSVIENLQQTESKKSTYTQSISNEVSTRENEMRVIVVKKGDTLSMISKRAYGSVMSYDILVQANQDLIKNPNRIYIGQRLRVPLAVN